MQRVPPPKAPIKCDRWPQFLLALVAVATFGYRISAAQPAATTHPADTDAADAKMISELQSRHRALTDARSDLIAASLVVPRNDAVLAEKAKAVADLELALADAESAATARKQQAAANKATADRSRQIPAIPNLTCAQSDALTLMAGELTIPMDALNAARGALAKAAFAEPVNEADIHATAQAVGTAELNLATIRADAFAKVQASAEKLAPDQVTAFVAMGGVLKLGGFSEPRPIDFNDHDGYVSLFDGTTLKGWDGNPKIWRVENGSIVGESTPANPSGNSYLVYRDTQAKDFTLKFEIKVDGSGGSGMQYRSKTGIPWLAPVAENLQPVNLNWMMTGPQADFWPSQIYSGQFYSENTPMRIMAWRGQVVEGAGLGTKRLMANIGDRTALGKLENKTDWNQYTVIARGGTLIQIMNGQLMSVMIDDDPTSSNNQSGLIGIEIEAITKVYVRNVWLKKLN